MKLVNTVRDKLIYAWERNTLLAQDIQAVPRKLDIKFHWSASALNDGNQLVDHSIVGHYSNVVADLFNNTVLTWQKDEKDMSHLGSRVKVYPTTRYMASPYNPTMENIAGMIFAVAHRTASALNYNSSESEDLDLEAITITDSVNELEVHFRLSDFTNGNFFNGAEFVWSQNILDQASHDIPLDKLFTDEFRIDLPKPAITVNPYE